MGEGEMEEFFHAEARRSRRGQRTGSDRLRRRRRGRGRSERDQFWTLNFKLWTHRVAVCRFLLISRLDSPAICWALSPRVSLLPRRAGSTFARSGAEISARPMFFVTWGSRREFSF